MENNSRKNFRNEPRGRSLFLGEAAAVLRLDRVFRHEITTPTAIQDLKARARTGCLTRTKSRPSLTM
ncbi:MAG: hypothetical protein U5K27_02570 [Desulfotignum sp.]|nr:hypothetical protein [Desulfotignum sp.]